MNLKLAIVDVSTKIDPFYRNSVIKLVKDAILDSAKHVVGRRDSEVFGKNVGAYGKFSRFPFKDIIKQCYHPSQSSNSDSPLIMQDEKDIDAIVFSEVCIIMDKYFKVFDEAMQCFMLPDGITVSSVEVFPDNTGVSGSVRLTLSNSNNITFHYSVTHHFSTKGAYFPKVGIAPVE